MLTLSKETFERWWNTAVRPEDQSEFVHAGWRGTEEAAYFCCAYDLLRSRNENRDIVVQAYLVSQNIDPSAAKSAQVRIAAQGMYDEDSVQFLLDKVEYRKRAEAEERIHAIAVAKIEELNLRTKDENYFAEYGDQLATEKLVLDASLRYMTDRTKQKSVDMKRREQRALRDSMVKGKAELKNVTQIPSKEEIRQFAQMAKDMLTDKEFAEIFGGKVLPSGE
jgi:protease II